ncbi:hypothetical protein [Victivallis sp. Marseille-Q1083]|uniref:hypothetical protein n=1 Tax=Victivallis sp. Marseille-Q1083 TaxID=2717288 RepID=UPI00158BED41|nr:hypothetical protein [Victivallis sp. Marseille-Q1083]
MFPKDSRRFPKGKHPAGIFSIFHPFARQPPQVFPARRRPEQKLLFFILPLAFYEMPPILKHCQDHLK